MGGPENEGQSGIHAVLETECDGYVRRRCLGHLSWRTCDAMLEALRCWKLIKRLCEYLCEGSTWTRLQGLATTPLAEGGLALFAERSRRHYDIFGQHPAPIVDGRPESACDFLAFLRGKEHVLNRVCQRDVTDRDVARTTKDAAALLGDLSGRAARSVAAELLHRALFLHRWVNKHRHIAREQSFRSLLQQAKDQIQDTSLAEAAVKRLGTTPEEIAMKGWRPETWIELATLLVYDDDQLAGAELPRVWAVHASLVARATSHLALLEDNIMRT